jgi:hypothetical protein
MPRPPPGTTDKDSGAQVAPQQTVLPWSITLPVAAGVFLGALVLGLLLLAYWQGQQRETAKGIDAQAQTAEPPLHDAVAQPPAAITTAHEATTAQLPKLPGLIEANRLQLKTACIAGTIGHRQSNGWTQAVDRHVPRRCVATSQ